MHFVSTNHKYLYENWRTYTKVSNIENVYFILSAFEIKQPKDKFINNGRGKKEFCIWDNN